ASSWTVRANYATQAFTATAGSDYSSVSGSLTFAPGETTKTIAVPLINDTVQESTEDFFVNLPSLVNAGDGDSQGRGRILNDVLPALSINDVTVTEGDSGTTTATFTVTLSYASTSSATVSWATANGTATADPSPTLPDDYVAASGTLTFFAGQTSKTASVTVPADVKYESDEALYVNPSHP